MSKPLPSTDDARITELVRAYLVAAYRWELNGDWHDLHIGLQAPAIEFCYPNARVFGLLSAWNPYSIERSDAINRSADSALHNALMASGYAFRAAFSSARNRSWREPSWIVAGMPIDAFDALSRQFGQLGTLWWEAGKTVRLRADAPRPSDWIGDDYVDWLK